MLTTACACAMDNFPTIHQFEFAMQTDRIRIIDRGPPGLLYRSGRLAAPVPDHYSNNHADQSNGEIVSARC